MNAKATIEKDGSAFLTAGEADYKIGAASIEATRIHIRQMVRDYAAREREPQTLEASETSGL